jgi:metallo-beta-lactamase family protein
LLKAEFSAESVKIPSLDQGYTLGRTSAQVSSEGHRILPAAASRPDWHNARARLLIDLNAQLEGLATDADREALIATLAAKLKPGELDHGQGQLVAAAAG